MNNLYETLGVSRTATPDEIKKAYKEKAKQHHPDKEGGSEEKMKEIVQAYETLSDPDKRAYYDSTGKIQTHSREEMLNEMMTEMFMQALSDVGEFYKFQDIIKKAKGIAYKAMTEQRKSLKQAKDELKVLDDILKRIHRKNGLPNMLAHRIEVQIEGVKIQIAEMDNRLNELTDIHKMFDDYNFNFDKPTPEEEMQMAKSMAGSMGNFIKMIMGDDIPHFMRK